ncbi:unannotated protein [freshwater metagenome]|uniref:Unannotated protein n=1 Tax=freshwater metagenome TaxID=449393 RepID=A0A6J6N1Z7_9ZZZZ
MQLVQTLDGHVLLSAAQRTSKAAIHGVGQYGCSAFGIAGTFGDEPIERGLGVEHQRRQRPGAVGCFTHLMGLMGS